MLTAGRDDGRASDCHSLAVRSTPVTIDCIRKRRMNRSKKRGAYRSGQMKHPLTHDLIPLELPFAQRVAR
jgi:hypothetical protein